MITASDVKAQIETGFSDATIESIIVSVNREISNLIGPESGYTFVVDTNCNSLLVLPVGAVTIIKIDVEQPTFPPTYIEIASTEYTHYIHEPRIVYNNQGVWGRRVVVTFDPIENPIRNQIAIQLCALDMQYNPQERTEVGDDFSETSADTRKERNKLLGRLIGPVLR